MLELKQGTQLADRYTLVRRLGGDGETHTWLAKDRLTRASVALKISPGDPHNTAKLRAEWQASIRLMHAHIVRAFEFHAEEEAAFFSQQFIDGPDLGVLAGMPVSEVLGPVGLLVDALAYVHSKGVVHRDLKASNVLLDANGAPYLSDFGVSLAVGQAGSGGSPIARSPESIDGQPAATTDYIFALGSLIFELLSGRPPWSAAELAAGIEREDAVSVQAADGSEIPDTIRFLVAQMLDRDATRRPTASDVLAQLKDAGFAPRAATIRSSARAQRGDEGVEAVATIRPVSRSSGAIADVVRPEPTGLSQKTVGIALGILVVVLIGVVFVLPNNVANNVDSSQDEMPVAPDAADPRPPVVVTGDDTDRFADIYVDPEVRKRIKGTAIAPTRKLADDEDITFSENRADYSGLDDVARTRFDAESTLGELLSALEVLEGRGIDRCPARRRCARSERPCLASSRCTR